MQASLAVTCNKCVIDCAFGQYRTQYTPSRLRRSGVYSTVLPSPQSITHKYTLHGYFILCFSLIAQSFHFWFDRYRVHYNAHNTGADAATGTPSPLALELVVLSHIDIEPRVRELVGCRDGVKIAWLPFPTTFVVSARRLGCLYDVVYGLMMWCML